MLQAHTELTPAARSLAVFAVFLIIVSSAFFVTSHPIGILLFVVGAVIILAILLDRALVAHETSDADEPLR